MVKDIDYFRYALHNQLLDSIKFYYSTFTIPLQDKNEYYVVKNGKYFVYMNGKEEEVAGKSSKEPLLHMQLPITLYNADISNIEKSVDTTVGRAIVNYVALEHNFGSKLPYINEPTDTKKIEKIVGTALKDNNITVEEYINFNDSLSLLQGLTRIVVVSATPKTMTPPPGITEFKKKLQSEYAKKYGPDWYKDRIHVVEFADELKAFDTEYMKDDPTYRKSTSNKVANEARPKRYLSMGADDGFSGPTAEPRVVFNSLLEGYPEDKQLLASVYNKSRAGSFSRGNETKDDGLLANIFLRSTSNITVDEGDCGTTMGKELYVTKEIASTLYGRYQIVNGKSILIEKPESLIGKTITIRSCMYCKNGLASICARCAGDTLSNYRKGVSQIVTDVSGAVLNMSMKKMHATSKHLVKTNLSEMIK